MLVGVTSFVTFRAARRAFEDESFITKSNKISFNEEKVDEALIAKFKDIKSRIESDFYLSYDENLLVDGAIRGMVDGLNDPYTKYYTKQQMKDRNNSLQGEYIGIGVEIAEQKEDYIRVGSVKDDTPAAYAGIIAGDKIVAIDGKNLSEYIDVNILDIFAEINRKIALELVRGEDSLNVELTVSSIVEQSVFSEMIDDKIGYVRIAMFDAKVSKDFMTEIDGLLTRGMKFMVLDLRHNNGGLASEMSRIADSILPDGAMIYYERDNKNEKKQVKFSDAKALNIPIVILVNGSTASSAEILASALKDNDMAKLVGTKTYGKAVSQVTIPYSDGTGLVLTISQYFTKSEDNIQGVGLTPDVVIEPLEEYKNTKVQYIPRESDVQLEEAIKVLTK